ncbi:MAG: adenine deaminase [Trueperaceae bacterium]|nr:adenine deaminase [Trueperaceae bacterium]
MSQERPNKAQASLEEVKFAIDVAAGRKPASILIRNATVLNVFSLELQKTHVVLAGRLIAGMGESYEHAKAENTVDLAGKYLAPGLIDGHVHIESSLVTPAAYAGGVVPRGVTGVVCDPHEIGNVAGLPGIHWLLDSSEALPLDVWVTVPSCVPSTSMETSGEILGLAEIEAMLEHPRVVGVAEIMSFPDVMAADDENVSKALLAEKYRKSPEGHAPGLSGADLQAYLASGIVSDHESTKLEEGREKLANGVYLMVREGSVTRNLNALLPLIEAKHGDRIGFVTDDRLPHDLLDEGGVDCLVRMAISKGVDPLYAVRCASYNTAKHYALTRRGAIAPGYFADLVVLEDLASYQVASVFKEGKEVARGGKLLEPILPAKTDASPVTQTVKLSALTKDKLKLGAKGGKVRCIKPIHYQVLTEETLLTPTMQQGEVVADPERDLLKLICVERYGKNGGVGVGLISEVGLKAGALASSVGHDHHNILAVGVSDDDLITACKRLETLGGGFVAVKDGEVLAELALPIAGLVTDEPLEEVREKLDALEAAAKSLGNKLPAPFMTLSFLGLAVIPELRLTDKGLVDVLKSQLVSFSV